MAKVRSIVRMTVEMDDDNGTLIEVERKGAVLCEGAFVPPTARAKQAARTLFRKAERLLRPTPAKPPSACRSPRRAVAGFVCMTPPKSKE